MVKLFSKNSNLCDHNPPTSIHRQTERQTTCDRKTALSTKVHRAVKTTSRGLVQVQVILLLGTRKCNCNLPYFTVLVYVIPERNRTYGCTMPSMLEMVKVKNLMFSCDVVHVSVLTKITHLTGDRHLSPSGYALVHISFICSNAFVKF